MTAIEIGCKKCGSEDFQLLNPKTGEVLCNYCRNRWIEPSLIEMTETEKFLAEQAKRPQVIVDNTTETDKEIMNMLGNAAGMAGRMAGRGCARTAVKLAIIIVIVVVILFILGFCGFTTLLNN